MESLELIMVYYTAYLLMFLYSIMFITMAFPGFCWGLTKRKVTFNEPKCVTNPSIGQHAYLKLTHQDLTIHYVFNGEKGKPLMLFLHGFPEFWYSWKFQLKEFGKDYFAVAIDMVGYGKSSKPHGVQNYKPHRIATCIKDFVHELGYGDCVLVGHDWGTLIAYQVAAGDVYICSFIENLNNPRIQSWIFNRVDNYMFKVNNKNTRKGVTAYNFALTVLGFWEIY